jgi:hypothetical protein
VTSDASADTIAAATAISRGNLFCLRKLLNGSYDNTSTDFTYNDFTYNMNKCDITNMFLFTLISKVNYK